MTSIQSTNSGFCQSLESVGKFIDYAGMACLAIPLSLDVAGYMGPVRANGNAMMAKVVSYGLGYGLVRTLLMEKIRGAYISVCGSNDPGYQLEKYYQGLAHQDILESLKKANGMFRQQFKPIIQKMEQDNSSLFGPGSLSTDTLNQILQVFKPGEKFSTTAEFKAAFGDLRREYSNEKSYVELFDKILLILN